MTRSEIRPIIKAYINSIFTVHPPAVKGAGASLPITPPAPRNHHEEIQQLLDEIRKAEGQ